MKRALITSIFCTLSALTLFSQSYHDLEEVVVSASRPAAEIGVQKTEIDSAALKGSIAQSLADVITFNSSAFVKSSGRASLSTVAFRGTSASHTDVTWNGLRINSPMLGMTDFSTLPSFFIDRAALLHGGSSLTESGGGLGGHIRLSTSSPREEGLKITYVQGIGSFSTFDEFLKSDWRKGKWSSSTRVSYSSSRNDYTYINRDKKENVYGYDEAGNKVIVSQYHPKEKNRSGAFKDFNVLEQLTYRRNSRESVDIAAWLTHDDREIPMLSTDYSQRQDYENRQRETTLRASAAWKKGGDGYLTLLRAGYLHSHLAYDYSRETAEGIWSHISHTRSDINSFNVDGEVSGSFFDKISMTVALGLSCDVVDSKDGVKLTPDQILPGYRKSRFEGHGSVALRWIAWQGTGISVMSRYDKAGGDLDAVGGGIFADHVLLKDIGLTVKGSATLNQRMPTLNDLYFLPGGNSNLKSESARGYDAGLSMKLDDRRLFGGTYVLSGNVTWYDNRIDDWIIWLPTVRGYFSPSNIRRVHSYGLEAAVGFDWEFARGWQLAAGGNFAWTPSKNLGNKDDDTATDLNLKGKQLPYIPLNTASANARIGWKGWSAGWQWMWYSERYTQSNNATSLTGRLPAYTVSNVSIQKKIGLKWCELDLKGIFNNVFDAEYLSILSRPMPGRNFEFFIGITPVF